jgi:mRNA-degrading endonuclease RelE of RelBE toxin-antitoxin system
MAGAATQICSPQFDADFFRLSPQLQARFQAKLDDLGRRLESCPHHRMAGVNAFRLRIGDYRIIYRFDAQKNELTLVPWVTGARFIEINGVASVKSPLHGGAHLVRFPAPHLAELI